MADNNSPSLLSSFFRAFLLLQAVAVLLASFNVLRVNEAMAVKRLAAIDALSKEVISIYAHVQDIDEYTPTPAHVMGTLRVSHFNDKQFGVTLNAVAARRVVEVLQWVEEVIEAPAEDNSEDGEKREYRYSLEWRRELIDASTFAENKGEYKNPATKKNADVDFYPTQVQMDNVEVSRQVFDGSAPWEKASLHFEGHKLVALYEHLDEMGATLTRDDYVVFDGADMKKVGAERIFYEIIPVSIASAVGYLTKSRVLVPYRAEDGTNVAKMVFGRATEREVLSSLYWEDQMQSWSLRIAGFLFVWIAVGEVVIIGSSQLSKVAYLREYMLGVGKFFFSLVCTLCISVVFVGACWFEYKPSLSAAAVFMSVLLFLIIGPKVIPGKPAIAVRQPRPPPSSSRNAQ